MTELEATRQPNWRAIMDAPARLRAMAAALTERVVDEMYQDPFWDARFGARGRAFAVQDGRHHVSYLAEAMSAQDPGIAARYAAWLQSVLTTRGMCTRHLDENFARLGRAIDDALGSDVVAPYVAAARGALLYGDPAARSLQDSADALVSHAATAAPATVDRDELATLLSFLADAVAQRRPPLLEAHALFLVSFHDRRGRDGATQVRASLEAVERALDQLRGSAVDADHARAAIAAARAAVAPP